MSKKLIEVRHDGIEETAFVPETALKHMKGWTPVETSDVATGDGSGGKDYQSMKVDALRAEVHNRNIVREVPIEVEEPGNKPELVAALEADDKKES